MTNPTTTDADLRIDVNATLANIFGCHDDEDHIDQLCAVSDWAYNTRLDLIMANSWLNVEHSTSDDVLDYLARYVNLTVEQLVQFVQWERV
jgi:hypothetical protein